MGVDLGFYTQSIDGRTRVLDFLAFIFWRMSASPEEPRIPVGILGKDEGFLAFLFF
jgi:hypothetical protein